MIQQTLINIQGYFETWQLHKRPIYSTFIICIKQGFCFHEAEAFLIIWCFRLKFENWPYLVPSLPRLLTVSRAAICIFTSMKKTFILSHFHSDICYKNNKLCAKSHREYLYRRWKESTWKCKWGWSVMLFYCRDMFVTHFKKQGKESELILLWLLPIVLQTGRGITTNLRWLFWAAE